MIFKAFSIKSPDAEFVYKHGRERGVELGEIIYVFGDNRVSAIFNLDVIRQTFKDNKSYTFISNKRDCFEVSDV